MKQKHEQPPNWPELEKAFGVKWGEVVVTFGDTCYCKESLSDDLVEHESLHVTQQTGYDGGPTAWWARYMIDPEFRLSQELPAYKKQFNFIRKKVKDRNQRHKIAVQIAKILSGKTYGNLGNFDTILRALLY